MGLRIRNQSLDAVIAGYTQQETDQNGRLRNRMGCKHTHKCPLCDGELFDCDRLGCVGESEALCSNCEAHEYGEYPSCLERGEDDGNA